MPVTVHEITMAAPDIVCVEVRDPPIVRGEIINTGSLITENQGTVSNVANNGSGGIRITASTAVFGSGGFCQPQYVWGFHSIGGVPNANGVFQVTWIDASTVDLIGPTFSGSYTSGGAIIQFEKWFSIGGVQSMIVGAEMTHVRTTDVQPTVYLDRDAADVAGDYGTIGGLTVTSVYRRTCPYSTGVVSGFHGGPFLTGSLVSKHFLYLHLSGTLAEGGPYTIDFPTATGIANAAFTFDDKVTRSIAIHVSGVGHRPNDHKMGYLSKWIPLYGSEEGAVDYAGDYGVTEFDIVDGSGNVVFGPEPVVERLAWNEAEHTLAGFKALNVTGGYADTAGGNAISSSVNPIPITSISAANPAVLTSTGSHGFSNGQTVRTYFTAFAGQVPWGNLNNETFKIKVLSGTTCSLFSVAAPTANVSGYANNGSGAIRLQADAAIFTADNCGSGFNVNILNAFNTVGAAAACNGTWPVTFIDSTHVDLVGSTMSDTWLFAGSISYWKAFDASAYSPAYSSVDGLVFKVYQSNSSGTYVYGLDYSAFTTVGGPYYVRVAGIGVSDPITISEHSWYDVAKVSSYGEYNHRFGIALEASVGGFERPHAFDGRVNVFGGVTGTMVQSYLPYAFNDLSTVDVSQKVSGTAGSLPTWITSTPVPTEFGGSLMDAGDWVQRIQQIAAWAYNFCDFAHHFPAAAAATNFGTPKSSVCLDPVLYAGTDGLPDVVHQAIFMLDTFRRTAAEAEATFGPGARYGGCSMTTGTGTPIATPSYLMQGIVYTYAPDHYSSFAYAGGCAKLAKTLSELGFTALAAVWLTEAEEVWDWCLPLYLNPTGEYDDFYIGVLDIQTRAGWSTPTYEYNRDYMNGVINARAGAFPSYLMAAGALFEATNDSTYGDIVEDLVGVGGSLDQIAEIGLGCWAYQQAATANSATRDAIRHDITTRADFQVMALFEATPVAYEKIQYRDVIANNIGGLGGNFDDLGPLMIRAHLITVEDDEPDNSYMAAIQSGLCFVLGANQLSMSFTQELGARWPGSIFCADTSAMGQTTPPGIGCYGYLSIGQGTFAFFNFGSGFLNYIINYPEPASASDFEYERMEYPNNWATPVYEAFHESTFVLGQNERTVQQNVLPLQQLAMYAWAFDGNDEVGEPDEVELPQRRPRIRLR